MRLIVPFSALAVSLVAPTLAHASPFAISLPSAERLVFAPPASDDAAAPSEAADAGTDAVEANPDGNPGADPGPAAGEEPAATDADGETVEGPAPEGEGPEGEGEAELDPLLTSDPTEVEGDGEGDEAARGKKKKEGYNANAVGIAGGIQVIPSYFLSTALASYANSMCRQNVGAWGEENGLVKTDGCNFYVNGGYTRRISRAFDVNVAVGYLQIRPPDALWIDNAEWDRDSCTEDTGPGTTCNLGAADYTTIDLSMVTIEANFIGRGTLFRNDDVEIQLGGGGGVGLGIAVGNGVTQTPLGPNPGSADDPGSCTTLADTADFRRCTPRYYDEPDIDQNGDGLVDDVTRDDVDGGAPPPNGEISTGNSFASCSRDKCDESDLEAFGSREQTFRWAVYPLINILGSFRVIVKDTVGIEIQGGFKNGFFFGGGVQYFFGGGGKR